MATKNTKRREKKAASSKKATARKVATGRKRVGGPNKRAAKKHALGPIERAGEDVVNAARRLWLSAESVVTSRVASVRKSVRKARAKVSG